MADVIRPCTDHDLDKILEVIRSASCAMGRGTCAHWECATRHAPLERHRRGHPFHGVGSQWPFVSSKLSRDPLRGVHPRPVSGGRARSGS